MLLLSFILSLITLQAGVAFPSSQNTQNSGTTKLEFQNISIQDLDGAYMGNFTEDLTFLNISQSKIGRIDKWAFDSLKHLNLLDLSDNDIGQEIHPETFSRLPGLEMLFLRNIGLRRVHLNLKNVQELILVRNEIREIGGERITGDSLNYLDVSSNELGLLSDSFRFLSKMSMIDISRNKISSIGDDVFKDNTNLVRILASENHLSSTEGLRLPWLKTLDLFANKFVTLSSDAFPGMASLEELVLAFNNINDIQDTFKDLLELKYLNLAWNHIEELRPDLFRNNLYLSKLSLQGNKLQSLVRFASVHHHLSHLDLSHNVLELLDDEFFWSTPNLAVLDLSFNRLKTLTDVQAPLASLKVLDLAYNRIAMSGFQFFLNPGLARLNLSSNMVEGGLSLFRHNSLLTSLDLSHNQIFHFCDSNLTLANLATVNLRGNSIKNLSCLKGEKFGSLCQVDLRNNPLTCGEELDDVILDLAMRKGFPFALAPGHLSDIHQSQCETLTLNKTIDLWNLVKRDLCPSGVDIQAKAVKEWDSEEEDDDSEALDQSSVEESEEKATKTPSEKQFIAVPLYWIPKDDLINVAKDSGENQQSERLSWEDIDRHPELIDDLEDGEEASAKKARYSWYIIAPVLIGLSLTLTCCNLAVFMYIRLKVWKKSETSSPQKYTILHNEVYKNTTEPTPAVPVDGDWGKETQTRNKIFSYGKINEFLLNFGIKNKENDAESAKNVLIDSSSTPSA